MKVLVLEACNLLLSTNTAKSNRLTGICLLFTSFKTKAQKCTGQRMNDSYIEDVFPSLCEYSLLTNS